MRRVGHVENVEDRRGVYMGFGGENYGKRPLGRPTRI